MLVCCIHDCTVQLVKTGNTIQALTAVATMACTHAVLASFPTPLSSPIYWSLFVRLLIGEHLQGSATRHGPYCLSGSKATPPDGSCQRTYALDYASTCTPCALSEVRCRRRPLHMRRLPSWPKTYHRSYPLSHLLALCCRTSHSCLFFLAHLINCILTGRLGLYECMFRRPGIREPCAYSMCSRHILSSRRSILRRVSREYILRCQRGKLLLSSRRLRSARNQCKRRKERNVLGI
jgi:hypothetical protein